MKITIQGHPTRGKEVIQILENLGGINRMNHSGCYINYFYYISSDDKTIAWTCVRPKYFNVYTLEEFEKEFPFKVGDKVIHKEFNDFFEVISFNPESSYPYEIKGVCKFNTKSHVLTKWQPKMKEERFVTLSFKKAKEWYKKGGELKEIALQAFSEKELTKVDLPKTWEEFCDKYSKINDKEYFIDTDSNIEQVNYVVSNHCRLMNSDRNICPSKKSAEAHLAMIQLEQLRGCWIQDWKPDWNDCQQVKYCIVYSCQEFKISTLCATSHFLSFPTGKMAEEFLKCFRDLIEKAGDLI